MYTVENFKTKKQLKEAIATGKSVPYYQPGPFGGNEKTDGTIFLEGPHFPAPHKWYAQATVRYGAIISVK